MTLNIKLLSLLLVLLVNTAIAQTTAIPDPNFEQALIDMNIDSDGVVNGQVLTADIENIIELNFENVPFNNTITNLSGIENFTSLEILDFHYYDIDIDISQYNILNNNINLREIVMMNECADCSSTYTPFLDLSGLPNLETINLTNVIVQTIKINNPSFDLTNLSLSLYHEGFPGGDWTQHICIEVADPQAATNNQFPYNTWNITVNNFTTTYGFEDTCTLSVNDFDKLNSISAYPNPVQNKLWFDNPNQIEIDKAEIYNISGQKIKTFSNINGYLDVDFLSSGVYFAKVYGENSSSTFKVLKH
jgi:hypothetical protein